MPAQKPRATPEHVNGTVLSVFAYPDIRFRIYPLILWQPKIRYLKVKIWLLRLFAEIV